MAVHGFGEMKPVGPSRAEGDPGARAGGQTEFVRQSWTADVRQLGPIRKAVRQWLAPLAMSDDARNDVVFAVSEAVTNAIEHAYATGPRPKRRPHATSLTRPVSLTLWT
jgi:hypothetical protein